MVVTRRTPVVPPPQVVRNHSPQGTQRPARTSLSKDAAAVSKDATFSGAAASLAGPSNGNNDNRAGLVSVCSVRKTMVFEPPPSVLTSSIHPRSHLCYNLGSTFCISKRLEGLIIVIYRTTIPERSLKSLGNVQRQASFWLYPITASR